MSLDGGRKREEGDVRFRVRRAERSVENPTTYHFSWRLGWKPCTCRHNPAEEVTYNSRSPAGLFLSLLKSTAASVSRPTLRFLRFLRLDHRFLPRPPSTGALAWGYLGGIQGLLQGVFCLRVLLTSSICCYPWSHE